MYVCVYKCDTTVPTFISEYPEMITPKYRQNIATIIDTIPQREYRLQTIDDSDVNYTYFCNVVYIVVCVCNKDFGYRIVKKFIEDILNERAPNNITSDLLKEKINFYNDLNNDKVIKIQASLDDVKKTIVNNIDKTLDRGDRLDVMHSSSVTLAESANQFESSANDLRSHFWWKNVKLMLTICFVLFLVISLIILLSCGVNIKQC
jgi:hypothetical protein